MAIYLTTYQNANEKSTAYGKYYYRALQLETVDLDALAKHMANHNTPYSQGCIRGVLKDMCDCIKEIMLEGKKVKLSDLAIFSLGIHCTGASKKEDLSPNTSITGISFNAQGTGELSLRGSSLRDQMSFKTLALAAASTSGGSDTGGSDTGGSDTGGSDTGGSDTGGFE